LRGQARYGKHRRAFALYSVRRAFATRCRSSVVEHPLGKGEVVSSILTGSTRKFAQIRHVLSTISFVAAEGVEREFCRRTEEISGICLTGSRGATSASVSAQGEMCCLPATSARASSLSQDRCDPAFLPSHDDLQCCVASGKASQGRCH
jgi:hypothetical protein